MLNEVSYDEDATMEKFRGDEGSRSTTPASSSVEREPDSDDEAVYGPNKRRERNLSRTRELAPRRRLSPKSQLEKNRQRLHRVQQTRRARHSSSPDSVASTESQDSANSHESPDTTFRRRKPSDVEKEWHPISEDDDSSSSDVSAPPFSRPVRLKLNPPKTGPAQGVTKIPSSSNAKYPIHQGRQSSTPANKANADPSLQCSSNVTNDQISQRQHSPKEVAVPFRRKVLTLPDNPSPLIRAPVDPAECLLLAGVPDGRDSSSV
jgi:hypothetical protein